MLERLRVLFRQRIVAPILSSDAPASEVAWAVGIGLFIGLTPTMGVQMYIAAGVWLLCRPFRFHFNMPVAVAMVWVTNPLTVIPIYYAFLLAGTWALGSADALSYEYFRDTLTEISEQPSTWEVIVDSTHFLLVDLGWPMVIGSLFFAIPGALLGYFLTLRTLKRRKALGLGPQATVVAPASKPSA